MRTLAFAEPGEHLTVLCLGAHSDDIEIGAGGTILSLIESGVRVHAHWCVASAPGERAREATASAEDFLKGAAETEIVLGDFRDGYLPAVASAAKDWMEALRRRINPDLILTHSRLDAHQDHRMMSELTWNTFRDHFIMEYEIPKWDGDLGQPNYYVPLTEAVLNRKIDLLLKHFGSQRSKGWFDRDTFRGIGRLRGMECRAPERFAEAFYLRKATAGLGRVRGVQESLELDRFAETFLLDKVIA